MDKKPFPKITINLKLGELGILKYPDVEFSFWEDPSQKVLFTVMGLLFMSQEDLDQMDDAEKDSLNARFFAAVSELIVDCDIDGLDFSTPKSAEESFYHEALPWGLMYEVILMYIVRLTETNARLKKTLTKPQDQRNSGKNSAKKG